MHRTAVVIGATAVLAVAPWALTSAQAGTDNIVHSSGGAKYAHFENYGDNLLNCDARSDGHHAVVQWVDSRNPGRTHTNRNHKGAGTCVTPSPG